MVLRDYRRRRNFERTPEPRGDDGEAPRGEALRFVVQKHAARRLHYDFRLELDGVLLSWAVPKGPSLLPGERRMAVRTEDHPLAYAGFEGVIPAGEYGGGAVLVWDRGTWRPIGDPHVGLEKGHLELRLEGEKLRGRWHLVRLRRRARDQEGGKESWLLIKASDAEARRDAGAEITEAQPRSVLTGRDLEAVARDADRTGSGSAGEVHATPEAAREEPDPPVRGARRAPLPRRLEPQLAMAADEPPDGDAWLHELKLDGYRLVCRIEAGGVRLLTRAGHDWTARFPRLAEAVRALRVDSAILDGEAAVLDARGRSDFQALQRALRQACADVTLHVFDLPYLDGFDLRDAPLTARKAALRGLLARAPAGSPLRYNDHVVGRGPAFFAEACRSGVEGVVSKRAEAPYRSGRSGAWLKLKCSRRQEFVVVGYTDPAGARVGFGALLLGAHDDAGALRYCGRAGTGFDDATLRTLHARLRAIERATPPVATAPRARGLHWVEPVLVAEVAFGEWTRDGLIRHPRFLGLREDKPAGDVRIEAPDATSTPDRAATPHRAGAPAGAAPPARRAIGGVRLSSPGRIYFPELGITKRELAEYYETMAERVLPGLAQRPLTLLRCPEGREGPCFFQKRANESVPDEVPRVVVEPGKDPYAMVTDVRSLIALVQIGVLELHAWNARADRLDRPDLLVFDLDPGPEVPWRRVVETARVLRAWLVELALVPFVRGTGGKGLHVVVPLVRRSTWDELKGFAQAVADTLVRQAPDRFTTRLAKRGREAKIFVDVLRNAPEATSIASWSARARPGAPVAVPLAWDELAPLERPPHVSVREAPARLGLPDPWADFEASRRALNADRLRRAGIGIGNRA